MTSTRAIGSESPYVMYVDDEEPNLVVFQAACAHLFPTLTARDAQQALALMERHEVAVVLADQRMPGVTGVELLARAHHLYPSAVRMLVTAYSNLDAAIAAINQGMVRRYTSKPWTTSEMIATVGDAYEVYKTEAALRGVEQRLLETERYYALGVVSAGIAHELRNPASWVSNSIDLCRRTIDQLRQEIAAPELDRTAVEELLGRVEQLLENALDGGKRILDIVRTVEGPTRQQATEAVDMEYVWNATLRLLEYHTAARVPIHVDGGEWAVVMGSSTALGQILSNVLINAVEAVQDQPDGKVWVTHRADERELWVDIDDNGSGIADEACERIFDPFHTSGKAGGTGLGLAISRRIAREHGGDLTAGQSPRGGARFRLRIPLRPGAN